MYFNIIFSFMRRDKVVGVVTKLWVGRSRIRFAVGAKYASLHRPPQTLLLLVGTTQTPAIINFTRYWPTKYGKYGQIFFRPSRKVRISLGRFPPNSCCPGKVFVKTSSTEFDENPPNELLCFLRML